MTWYFTTSGTTIDTIEFDDGQGNVMSVATDVPFSGSWTPPVPDEAVYEASTWAADQAANGNTQLAITALAKLVAKEWIEERA